VHVQRRAGALRGRQRSANPAFALFSIDVVSHGKEEAEEGKVPEEVLLLYLHEEQGRVVPQGHDQDDREDGPRDELREALQGLQDRGGGLRGTDIGLRRCLRAAHPRVELVRQLVVLPERPLGVVCPLPPEG